MTPPQCITQFYLDVETGFSFLALASLLFSKGKNEPHSHSFPGCTPFQKWAMIFMHFRSLVVRVRSSDLLMPRCLLNGST